MTKKILLIRHGETAWSREGKYCGHTDIALNENGKRQARELAPRLRDFGVNFGKWEGLRYDEVMRDHAAIYSQWLEDPFRCAIPGGESLPEMATRIRNAVKERIIDSPEETVGIVTHAGPVKVILCDWMNLDLKKEIWRLQPAVSNAYALDSENGKTRVRILGETGWIPWEN